MKSVLKKFLMFLFFSLGAGIIELVSFELLSLISHSAQWLVVCDIISLILSCTFNLTLNRKYTFKSSNNLAKSMILYAVFYCLFLPLGAGLIWVLVNAGMVKEIAKLIKMILNFVLEFAFFNFILFKIKQKSIAQLQNK